MIDTDKVRPWPHDGVARWFARRLRLVLFLIAAATACAAAASLHWFLELFSHFTPHSAAAAFVLALAFLAFKAPRWAGASAVVVLGNVALIAHNFVSPRTPDPAGSGTRFGVLHFNVGDSDPTRVIDYALAHAERVDVVVLIEARTHWAADLRRLEQVYPHSVRALEDSPWGLAVFSKMKPLASALTEAPDGNHHAELRFAIDGRRKPVALYAIHPPPPVGPVLADARNEKLDRFARTIRSRGDETAIVVGDFNLTPYSPYFRRFAQASGLLPARAGLWSKSTWPGMLASAWLGIPIDHAFIADDVNLIAHEVGPHLGSDHLPVSITLALP